MTRRERLMATLRGEPVDRPAVNFYEIGGYIPEYKSSDPFNVFNDPSWQPLLDLAWERTDLIRSVFPVSTPVHKDLGEQFTKTEEYIENGSRFVRTTMRVGGKTLTSLTRQDPNVMTIWTLEHLLKDTSDLEAYLQLPDEMFESTTDVTHMIAADEQLGDRGICTVETADPICWAASLFSMEDYTIIALTEQKLFHELLEKLSRIMSQVTQTVAKDYPGHLWRIYGPEFAAEPYLPPYLFEEYVVRYTGPMIQTIQQYGGFARLHCHGRISKALPHFVAMGATGTDPIEPPPQGDVELADVRREYGRDLVLFGNLEASDIENMDPPEFKKVVAKSLRDGTAGIGRGFVLLASSSPYGRIITEKTLANYQTMVDQTLSFGG